MTAINSAIFFLWSTRRSTIATCLAKRLQWAFEEGDSFHPKANVEKMRGGHPLTDEDRQPWLQAIAAEIDRERVLGQRVVIACSALKRIYRDILVHGQKNAVSSIFGATEN